MPGRREMIACAKEYALAERSDPFAFNRVMSHINNGLCKMTDRGDAHYAAEAVQVERALSNGEKYKVTEYKNVSRP